MAVTHYLADHLEYLPQVAAWLHKEWAYLSATRTVEEVQAQVTQNCYKDTLPCTLILLHEGEAIGTAALNLYDMHTHPHLPHWLAAVYIKPEYRGQGWGKQLTIDATYKAFELGVKTLYLATPDKCGWYESFGWQFIEASAYNDFLTVSIMKREAPRPLILDWRNPPPVISEDPLERINPLQYNAFDEWESFW